MNDKCNLLPFAGYFIRPFYKMMLDRPITLADMESVVGTLANVSMLTWDL